MATCTRPQSFCLRHASTAPIASPPNATARPTRARELSKTDEEEEEDAEDEEEEEEAGAGAGGSLIPATRAARVVSTNARTAAW